MNIDNQIRDYVQKNSALSTRQLQVALGILEFVRLIPLGAVRDLLSSMAACEKNNCLSLGEAVLRRLSLRLADDQLDQPTFAGVSGWGSSLLDLLLETGFADADDQVKALLVDRAEAALVLHFQAVREAEPLLASVVDCTAQFVINDVLQQADTKRKSMIVARHLVGAILKMRFKTNRGPHATFVRGLRSQYAPDVGSDRFNLANATIQIVVGMPNEALLDEIANGLECKREVWLLTRASRVEQWKCEIDMRFPERRDSARIAVTSVEAFVGQNITELGEFYNNKKAEQLRLLFQLYNSRLDQDIAAHGIRIETKCFASAERRVSCAMVSLTHEWEQNQRERHASTTRRRGRWQS